MEHYGGAFPLWLAPVQVILLPIADRHHQYAKSIQDKLQQQDIRVELDYRNEKIGFKIREAEVQKIPYMIIIGDKELENDKISVRHKGEGDLGSINLSEFQAKILQEIQLKK